MRLKAIMTLDHGERDWASGTSSAAACCVTEAGHLTSLDPRFLFCKWWCGLWSLQSHSSLKFLILRNWRGSGNTWAQRKGRKRFHVQHLHPLQRVASKAALSVMQLEPPPAHHVISPLSPSFPALFPFSFNFFPFLSDWIIYLFLTFLTHFSLPHCPMTWATCTAWDSAHIAKPPGWLKGLLLISSVLSLADFPLT